MSNAIDYLDWRGDVKFDAAPFNEIDAVLAPSSPAWTSLA